MAVCVVWAYFSDYFKFSESVSFVGADTVCTCYFSGGLPRRALASEPLEIAFRCTSYRVCR